MSSGHRFSLGLSLQFAKKKIKELKMCFIIMEKIGSRKTSSVVMGHAS